MSGFTDTFTGSPVQPSQVAFRAFALSVNVTLAWPSLVRNATNTTAKILEVTPTVIGKAVTLPPASEAALGEDILFYNRGAFSFTVKDNAAASIGTIPAGAAVYIYLTSNSSVGGSWGVFTFGTGTSAADAASLAGIGLVPSASTLNQTCPVLILTNNVNVTTAHRAQCLVYESGTYAVNLPVLNTMIDDGFFISVANTGSGTITVTPDITNPIDEAAAITFGPGESGVIHGYKTGGKWFTVGRGRSVIFNFSYLSKNVAGSSNVTLTSSEAGNKLIQLTGALTGNINVIFPNVSGVWYVYNNTSGAFSVTFKAGSGAGNSPVIAQSQRDILICYGDGSNSMYQAITNQISSTAFSAGSNAAPSITFIGDNDTGFFSPGANLLGAAAGGVEIFRYGTAGLSLSRPLNEAQSADIPSAPTIDLSLGNLSVITGINAISAITIPQGAQRTLYFSTSLTLINSSILDLLTGDDIVTEVGDFAVFVGFLGFTRMESYSRADGSPLFIDGGSY